MNFILCPITGTKGCKQGCCSSYQQQKYDVSPNIGISCGPRGSCNQKRIYTNLWGQSLQNYQTAYPPLTIGDENITAFGDIHKLPTAYGGFLAYTPEQWRSNGREKLESGNWRWVYGRSLQPGSGPPNL